MRVAFFSIFLFVFALPLQPAVLFADACKACTVDHQAICESQCIDTSGPKCLSSCLDDSCFTSCEVEPLKDCKTCKSHFSARCDKQCEGPAESEADKKMDKNKGSETKSKQCKDSCLETLCSSKCFMAGKMKAGEPATAPRS